MCGDCWGIADPVALVAGVDLDLAARKARFEALICKGRMTRPEADHVLGLLAEIRRDLVDRVLAVLPPGASCDPLDPAYSWSDKCRWIRGALAEARADFPEAVAKGRLDPAAAASRTAALAALEDLYWRRAYGWLPPCNTDDEAARAALRAHVELVAAEDGQQQGSLI